MIIARSYENGVRSTTSYTQPLHSISVNHSPNPNPNPNPNPIPWVYNATFPWCTCTSAVRRLQYKCKGFRLYTPLGINKFFVTPYIATLQSHGKSICSTTNLGLPIENICTII